MHPHPGLECHLCLWGDDADWGGEVAVGEKLSPPPHADSTPQAEGVPPGGIGFLCYFGAILALLENVLPSEICSEIWNCLLARYPQPNPAFLLILF